MFLSLLFRSGRPMLSGAVLTACGVTMVVLWTLTGSSRGAILLVRFGILATLADAVLMALTAYRRRHQPPADPPADASRD